MGWAVVVRANKTRAYTYTHSHRPQKNETNQPTHTTHTRMHAQQAGHQVHPQQPLRAVPDLGLPRGLPLPRCVVLAVFCCFLGGLFVCWVVVYFCLMNRIKWWKCVYMHVPARPPSFRDPHAAPPKHTINTHNAKTQTKRNQTEFDRGPVPARGAALGAGGLRAVRRAGVRAGRAGRALPGI